MSPPRIRPGCEPFAFEGGDEGVLMVHGLTGSPASMRLRVRPPPARAPGLPARAPELEARANDIAKPGVDENGDAVTPVAALAEMAAMLKVVRSGLPEIHQPLVIFRSGADHVAPRSNPKRVLARVGSERTELVPCSRSFHVVTLDHDASLVRERLLAFAREVGGEKG